MTPEAARKLYDETVKSLTPEHEVRARHILVETEDEAKKAYERVKGGEDFAKVAGELSKDPGSKTEGGDLGFFTKDRMVEPFAETAFKLEPGQISDPVKTPVRLARHQGRGEARQAGADLRGDEGADRHLSRPQGAAGPDHGAAPEGARSSASTPTASSSSRRSL